MKFAFRLSFWEHFLASMALILHSPVQLVLSSIFPLAGIGLLALVIFIGGRAPNLNESLLVLSCLGFTPLITLFVVWFARHRNRLVEGDVNFSFNDEGLSMIGPLAETKVKWEAIRKVVETSRFFLFFFSSQGACLLPKRVIEPDQLEVVRSFLQVRSSRFRS